MSDRKNRGNCLDTKQSSNYKNCITGIPQICHNSKRIKHTIKKCTNRVTFAMEDVYIKGYTPYEFGVTDADVIRLYHNDIWYNKTDYNSFMQDRIDTIRVYHSVKGNMSGLHDYYCIHGLESFLAIDQPMKVGLRLRRNSTSVGTDHFTRDLSHPTKLSSSRCTSLFTFSNAICLNNAKSTSRKPNESRISEKQTENVLAAVDEDSISHASVDEDPYGNNVSLPSTIQKRIHSVDVKSLRMLNMKLLKSMCSDADLSTKSMLSTEAEAELSTRNSLLNIRYGSLEGGERQTKLLQSNIELDFSPLVNSDYKATMINVMNRALEITSACVDPMTFHDPSIELPGTMTSRRAFD